MYVKYLGMDDDHHGQCYEVGFSKDEDHLPSGEIETAIKSYQSLKTAPERIRPAQMPKEWQKPANLADFSKHEALGLCAEILDSIRDIEDQKDIVRGLGGFIGGGV